MKNTVHKFLLAALLGASSLMGPSAQAQWVDYQSMINRQMQEMNRNIAAGQQQVQATVQQRMQDPAVRQAYQRHLAEAAQPGAKPYDYPTFTYYYIYTNGFSAQGVQHMRRNEANIQAKEQAAVAGMRQAEANRAAAQQGLLNSQAHIANERGNLLRGNSTFVAGNGSELVLPHTWQRNTTHQYQGNTYRVDQSGQYWVATPGGWWMPLQQR